MDLDNSFLNLNLKKKWELFFLILFVIGLYLFINHYFKLRVSDILIYLFISIVVLFIIWLIYGVDLKANDVNYFNKYEFDLPGNEDPLLANYFIEGKMSANWFISGVLYLINKKIYVLEKKDNKRYIRKNKNNNQELPFYVSEIYLFLDGYLKNNRLDFLEFIKTAENLKYLKKGKNYSFKVIENKYNVDTLKFSALNKKISNKYESLFFNQKYFDSKGVDILKIFLLIAAVIIYLVSNVFTLLFLSVIFIIFANIFSLNLIFGRFTKEGSLKHFKWVAFKRYISDFSEIEKYPIEHVILWDDYLVYAITFGIVKENPLDISVY